MVAIQSFTALCYPCVEDVVCSKCFRTIPEGERVLTIRVSYPGSGRPDSYPYRLHPGKCNDAFVRDLPDPYEDEDDWPLGERTD